jgi:hypothetical protein
MMSTMVRFARRFGCFDWVLSVFFRQRETSIMIRSLRSRWVAVGTRGTRIRMRVSGLACCLTRRFECWRVGIFFSKDRHEEVIEVEEEPETVIIAGVDRPVKLMSQSEWMKGCPEGGEQGFLFSLYNELSQGLCPCPNTCGYSEPREKSDFFAILVRVS